MSYCVDMVDREFTIYHQHVVDAYSALFTKLRQSDHYVGVRNCLTMEALMEELRWPVEYDTEGNITDVEFNGEKYWEDEVIFEALAPYVKDGSYIEMRGEDGERWRWIFMRGRLRQITASIKWDYCHECRHKGPNGGCDAEPSGLQALYSDNCSKGSSWEPGIKPKFNVTQNGNGTIHKSGFHS